MPAWRIGQTAGAAAAYSYQTPAAVMDSAHLSAVLLALASLPGCVGTDFVDDRVPAEVRIATPPDTLAVGDTLALRARFFDEVGRPAAARQLWESSDPDVVAVTERGLAEARALGSAELTVRELDGTAEATAATRLHVGERRVAAGEPTTPTSRRGRIRTTSSYLLEGDFAVTAAQGGGLEIAIADDYRASTALPGLYLHLANNPATTAGALQVGPVEVFRGAHAYRVDGVALDDYAYLLYYCKPFGVKVGDGAIER